MKLEVDRHKILCSRYLEEIKDENVVLGLKKTEKLKRPNEDEQDVKKRIKLLQNKIRKGQRIYSYDGNQNTIAVVENTIGTRVVARDKNRYKILFDMLDIYDMKGKGYRWVHFKDVNKSVKSNFDNTTVEGKLKREGYVSSNQELNLKEIKDKQTYNSIKKLYNNSVGDEDYTMFLEFLKDIDNVLSRYSKEDENDKDENKKSDDDDDFGDLEDEINVASFSVSEDSDLESSDLESSDLESSDLESSDDIIMIFPEEEINDENKFNIIGDPVKEKDVYNQNSSNQNKTSIS